MKIVKDVADLSRERADSRSFFGYCSLFIFSLTAFSIMSFNNEQIREDDKVGKIK